MKFISYFVAVDPATDVSTCLAASPRQKSTHTKLATWLLCMRARARHFRDFNSILTGLLAWGARICAFLLVFARLMRRVMRVIVQVCRLAPARCTSASRAALLSVYVTGHLTYVSSRRTAQIALSTRLCTRARSLAARLSAARPTPAYVFART